MPSPTMLAFLAAAQVATSTPGDVSPDLAANATMYTGLAGAGLAAGSIALPPLVLVAAPVIALGPGVGHFVAGDPWRGAAFTAGGVAIPAASAFLIQVGQFAVPQTVCTEGHNCDPAFPIVPLAGAALCLAAEFWLYTWAVNDARATAIRKNEERRSQSGAAPAK